MARTCTICVHHRRDSMDKALLRGEQLKSIARRYGVSDDALSRHRRHMQSVIVKAAAQAEQKDLAYGSALLTEIGRIRADAERLQVESERRRDVRSALRAIHERLAVVELEAKLSGQIDTSPKNVTINGDQPGRGCRVCAGYLGIFRCQREYAERTPGTGDRGR